MINQNRKRWSKLNLKSPPPPVRNLVVSDKTLQKKRTSSSDRTPGDDSDFIVAIQESFAEIEDSMVKKKTNIKDIVGEIML